MQQIGNQLRWRADNPQPSGPGPRYIDVTVGGRAQAPLAPADRLLAEIQQLLRG